MAEGSEDITKESLLPSSLPRLLNQPEVRMTLIPALPLSCPSGTRQHVENSAGLVRVLREQKASLPQCRLQAGGRGGSQGGSNGDWKAGVGGRKVGSREREGGRFNAVRYSFWITNFNWTVY